MTKEVSQSTQGNTGEHSNDSSSNGTGAAGAELCHPSPGSMRHVAAPQMVQEAAYMPLVRKPKIGW